MCNVGDPGSIPGFGTSPGERDWLPSPVPILLPGEFHGQRNLVATVHGNHI